MNCGDACNIDDFREKDTPGGVGDWGVISALLAFLDNTGQDIHLSHKSPFSQRTSESPGSNHLWDQIQKPIKSKAQRLAKELDGGQCTQFGVSALYKGMYSFTGVSWSEAEGVLHSGDTEKGTETVKYDGNCCMKKPCCTDGVATVKLMCRIHIHIKDQYNFNKSPYIAMLGNTYYTNVHYYETLNDSFSATCK